MIHRAQLFQTDTVCGIPLEARNVQVNVLNSKFYCNYCELDEKYYRLHIEKNSVIKSRPSDSNIQFVTETDEDDINCNLFCDFVRHHFR